MAAEVAPDYARSCGHFGGKLEDVEPQPVLRMWPTALAHGVKRPVEVRVHKYYGIGQHWYVTLSEADNPVWQTKLDPPYTKEPHWMRPWEDRDGRGRTESKRCFTLGGVDNFITRTIKKYFPPETHTFKRIGEEVLQQENGKWHYKEGD